MIHKLFKYLINWLTREEPRMGPPLCDYERIRYEIRPCDVLLVEGRSRISEVIKLITQSSWSHSCLYIGRLYDIDDPQLRQRVMDAYDGEPNEQLVIEGMLGKGTIVSPLSNYRNDHIRICRPRGISRQDAQKVIATTIHRLGAGYDLRQLFDLMRFLFPWTIMPRRWRSTLFISGIGESTRAVCSTVIAEAFGAVNFPILPLVAINTEQKIELIQRSARLFTPRDFDYSPFFEIIKYPFIEVVEHGIYRSLPWDKKGWTTDGYNIIDPTNRSDSTLDLLAKKNQLPTMPQSLKKNNPPGEDVH